MFLVFKHGRYYKSSQRYCNYVCGDISGKLQKYAILNLLFLSFSPFSFADVKQQVPVPSYAVWMSGAQGRHAYDKSVVWLALEKSRDKYGPFLLTTVDGIAEIERARIQATKADRFQLHISPEDEIVTNNESFIKVSEPIIKGLLGYRQLIIRKEDEAKFNQIKSLEELKVMTVGQGVRWPDVTILRENGFKVIETISIESLFNMLDKHRFDSISLGLNESEGTLAAIKAKHPDLVIAKNLVLFFPMSVFFYVNSAYPELAERLGYGLAKAKKDGSFDTLFYLHFSNQIKKINEKGFRFFKLKNDHVSVFGASKEPELIDFTPQ